MVRIRFHSSDYGNQHKIRKEKRRFTVKTSGSREARIEPLALYWRAMMPDWMMHMAITMIKAGFLSIQAYKIADGGVAAFSQIFHRQYGRIRRLR